MKTSKKLMIGFTGILVFLMLVSAITLKVGYSKGITNEEQYGKHQNQPDPNYKRETLQPFHTLVLINGQADQATTQVLHDNNHNSTISQSINNVGIKYGDAYTLEHYENTTTQQSGDTLFIRINKPENITLTCPSLEAIQNNYCNIFIDDFTLSRLRITAGPLAGVSLTNNRITSLAFTGEKENSFSLNGNNTLDSLKITMGIHGTLRMEDITYKVADIKVDSLRELAVYGSAINNIKQIH